MQNQNQGDSNSLNPPAKRIPINQVIDLRFPTFEGLVTKISSNLSTTGMFVQSTAPVEVGTDFSFRIHIEEWSPIQGEARVIWTRRESESPERPAGMGVEFTHLDAQSRRMIRWLVDKHLQEGGTPFELGRLPAGTSRSGPSLATPRADSLAASSKSKTSSAPLFLIWTVILAAVALGAYFWWESRPSQSPRMPSGSIPEDSARVEPAVKEPSLVTSDNAGPEEPFPESDPADVSRVVNSWAAAWKDRRPNDLLELYAEEFTPSDGLSRDQWEATIRDRLDQPDFILVAVSGLNVSFPDINRANVTFYRSIRSESKNETGRLSLDMVARDGHWLIVRESEIE
jgi:uncharacterized protein (TIGR02266 family)